MPRNQDTSKATAARVRAKRDRWIKELIEAGYFVAKTGREGWLTETIRPGMQISATNGLRETYRVVAWRGDGKPVLRGSSGTFVGLQDYVFTVGPNA